MIFKEAQPAKLDMETGFYYNPNTEPIAQAGPVQEISPETDEVKAVREDAMKLMQSGLSKQKVMKAVDKQQKITDKESAKKVIEEIYQTKAETEDNIAR